MRDGDPCRRPEDLRPERRETPGGLGHRSKGQARVRAPAGMYLMLNSGVNMSHTHTHALT